MSFTATSTSVSTQSAFSGGTTGIAGIGASVTYLVGGTWLTGDEYTIQLMDSLSGLITQIGAGFVSGVQPNFLQTFSNKVYALSGASMYVCAIDSPLIWNDPNGSGNGTIETSNWYSTGDPLISMAAYQGKLAFFSRYSIQIWNTDANLANWSLQQILPNIGTMAPNSVQSIGDLDVMFLSDTGFRSLRQRDITLNAFVNDIGSPIDAIVQNTLLSGTGPSAVSVVEPTVGRYMCFLNGVIYVLSYFPSNKILAWSTYTPVDNNGNLFTPLVIQIFKGQVYFMGLDYQGNSAIWVLGGTDNNTYDKTKPKWQTGFFDAKTPGTKKNMTGVSVGINSGQGGLPLVNPDSWIVYESMHEYSTGDPTSVANPTTVGWKPCYNGKTSSFDKGMVPCSDNGTHVSIFAQANGDGGVNGVGGPATFNIMLIHEFPGNEE